MKTPRLVMGIDLGTSGVRIAVLNESKELLHTAEMPYQRGLSTIEDWEECTTTLIQKIPSSLKKYLVGCSVDGTSGTLLACNQKGKPLGDALPYHLCCPEQEQALKELLPYGGIASSINNSLARALRLKKRYGQPLLRHQADWITGWLLGNWCWGEEANNLRIGWDPEKKLWPPKLQTISWQKSLPLIVENGHLLSKLDPDKAHKLGLPEDLVVIAGTTDSNASVLSAGLGEEDGLTVLGSTIVVKRFVDNPVRGIGITNHRLMNRWLSGGASNTGGAILRKFFSDNALKELSQQIDPERDSGLQLRPMPFKGERFPVDDPNLEPILHPRPTSDSLYLHGIFEGLARIESQSWQKLIELGAPPPKRIITIGGGAQNPQWRRIRERITGFPIKTSKSLPAQGVALIALKAITNKSRTHTFKSKSF